MAIERKTVPYEYLVRFNADGSIRGQHIKYLDVLTDGGKVISEQEGGALSVGGSSRAVLLDTALGQSAAALARAAEVEQAARSKADAALEAVKAELAAVKAERDALLSAKA